MRLEKFGVFIDIGAERPGLVHISEMTHDYIKSPNDVVKEGDEVEVKVLGVNRRKKQIKLSMKALSEKPIRLPRTNPKDKKELAIQAVQPVQPAEEPTEKEEPIPTAMEQALRQAMKRAEDNHDPLDTQTRRRTTIKNAERENIFSRTLDNKVKTVSK
jgi:predicted RNA-binding protein with RPS1 domain